MIRALYYIDDDVFTVSGNPYTDKYWHMVKGMNLVHSTFENDDDQWGEVVTELRREFLSRQYNHPNLRMVFIGIDVPQREINEIATYFYNQGYAVADWDWCHDYYSLTLPGEELKLNGEIVGSDGFKREGRARPEDLVQ